MLIMRSVYPNPSRDIFNFRFVLSGNVLPNDFSLQIFSTEGHLVDQFGLDDVSYFVTGINDLLWNAAQANITNGIFIYRLTLQANGKTVSQSGKLVLTK